LETDRGGGKSDDKT